mgnify:CR=1 FL=1
MEINHRLQRVVSPLSGRRFKRQIKHQEVTTNIHTEPLLRQKRQRVSLVLRSNQRPFKSVTFCHQAREITHQ